MGSNAAESGNAGFDELCYRLKRLDGRSNCFPLGPDRPQQLLADDCGGSDSGDSGQSSGTPQEDYVCAFPALSQCGQARVRLDSAWLRGPPRALDDEGFLDDSGEEAASEGSEILQLVSHILHSFNMELAEGRELPEEPLGDADDDADARQLAPVVGSADSLWGPAGAALLPYALCDADAVSDHDFDDLRSEESATTNGETATLDGEAAMLDDENEDEAMPDEGEAASADGDEAKEATAVPAWSSGGGSGEAPTVTSATATATLLLPEGEVLASMANWSRLDRLRHELWSRTPLPPKPTLLPRQQQQEQRQQQQRRQREEELKFMQQQQQLQQQQQQYQYQQLDKSKRACSFLLRGHCKKEDCEFAHDLTKVTCKFWASGECFKGATCPFLHGYPEEEEEDEKEEEKEKEEKEKEVEVEEEEKTRQVLAG